MKVAVSGWGRDMGPTIILDRTITLKSIRNRRQYGAERTLVSIDDPSGENARVWIGSKSNYIALNGEYRLSVEFSVDELFVLLFGAVKNWSVSRLMEKLRFVGIRSDEDVDG